MINLKCITYLYILISSISISYADNAFVKTDLQLFQLQGPIKSSHTTYYDQNGKIDSINTQFYDKNGFLYMSMIDAYNPEPMPHVYQWHQLYKNNEKKILILFNNELLSFFPMLYPIDTELFRYVDIAWTDQGATANISLNNHGISNAQTFYQEKYLYDASHRIIRLELITKHKIFTQNIYYLSFQEYKNINLQNYQLNDVIYVTANKKEVKAYIEDHWQQLDPRIRIIDIQHVDQFGNPMIQYQYNSHGKQKITHDYLYYN